MSFFNHIKVIKDSLTKTTTNISNNIATANTEQSNLSKINKEIASINSEIDSACTQIGRKFLEYVKETKEMPGIDIKDILIDPKISKKVELEKEVIEIQKRLKDQMILQEKTKVEEEFKIEKDKLDKALAMDLISKEEYEVKVNQYKNRLDNFDQIKKIEQQYELGIITLEEKNVKINMLI